MNIYDHERLIELASEMIPIFKKLKPPLETRKLAF